MEVQDVNAAAQHKCHVALRSSMFLRTGRLLRAGIKRGAFKDQEQRMWIEPDTVFTTFARTSCQLRTLSGQYA
jgi:hypothetical protein